MGWNKNTISKSALPSTIATLKSLGIPHTVTVVGSVPGYGLNDGFHYGGNDSLHTLNQLEYMDAQGVSHVIRQQMQRTSDCDSDDYIIDVDLTGKSQGEIKATPLAFVHHDPEYCQNYATECENCPPTHSEQYA